MFSSSILLFFLLHAGEHSKITLKTRNVFIESTATDLHKVCHDVWLLSFTQEPQAWNIFLLSCANTAEVQFQAWRNVWVELVFFVQPAS